MVKSPVTGPTSGSLLSVSISALSSQVLNQQILWVVYLFDNAFPGKLIVLSNYPVMICLYFSNIILLICMISWPKSIVPSRYLNVCPADTECSGPISSKWGSFSSSNSTIFSKVNKISLWY